MVITVMGTAASGKTDFAVGYAAAWGKEGIYLVTEPAGQAIIPDRTKARPPGEEDSPFAWTTIEAAYDLSHLIEQINRDSNFFRAYRRVLVIDNLASWLHYWMENGAAGDMEALQAKTEQLLVEIGSFQGKMIIVTHETAGLPFVRMTEPERIYYKFLGDMNRRLAAISREMFVLTAGIPVEVKAKRFQWESEPR